ncbi:MAG: NUDIX domain-containing protein [Aquihabitans sp.]
MKPALFSVAVDLVVVTVADDQLQVLLIERGVEPFLGQLALPGGFVLEHEDPLDAAVRELAEETGVVDMRVHLEQLATYGHPDRDPRGRVLSVAYLALVPNVATPTAGSDAASAAWVPVAEALAPGRRLAFDHRSIVSDGVERARSKLEYTPLATAFCPSEFTVNELRRVYEVVWGTELDPRNFHRKVTGTRGFIEPTGRTTNRQGGRPAQLYRRGTAEHLHPAMLR